MTTLSIDIETYSGTDLATSGVYKYVEDPDFEILLIAYSIDGGETEVLDLASEQSLVNYMWAKEHMPRLLEHPDYLKTAWNAAFEITCLSKYFGIDLDPAQWDCSMVRAANAGLPLSLGECAKVIGNSEQKMAEGKALVKYFCEPCKPTKVNGGRTRNLPEHNPEKWAKFIEYCRQDVVTEMDIRSKLMFVKYTETERKLWRLDQMINRRGVAVDLPMVKNAIAMDAVNREALIEEAKQITGLSNPNSGPQLKDWLNANISTQVDSLTKEDVIYLIEVISKGNCSFRNGINKDTVLRVLEIKQKLSKTSVKKYSAIVESACSDNRVKGLLQFYGANRTGRWAGRIVQLHNLPRNMMKDLDLARQLIVKGSYEEFHLWYDDLSQPLSELIRTAFVPSEGNTFAVADFSAIEARVIAWLAGEEWVLEVFRTHGKIYEATAAQMFKTEISEVTKDLRQKGKVATLALGYQGGVGALDRMDSSKSIPDADKPGLVEMWRKANPNIVKLWYDCQRAAIQAVEGGNVVTLKQKGIKFLGAKNMLFVELPSGRRLSYVRPRLVEGEYGKKLQYWGVNQETKKWGLVDTYGGKICENLTQAIARDCLAESMLALDAENYKICVHIHDEVVIETPVEKAEKELDNICRIMGREISWAKGLPLSAAGYLTPYYKKD